MKPLFYISVLCTIIGCTPAQQEGSNLEAQEILQQAIHQFTEAPGYALEAHFHRVENGKVMQDEDAQVYFLEDSLDQVCQCQKRVIIPGWNLDFQYAGLATEVNHKAQGVKIEKVESNPLLNLFDAYGFWDITRIFSIHQQFIKELKTGIATVYPLFKKQMKIPGSLKWVYNDLLQDKHMQVHKNSVTISTSTVSSLNNYTPILSIPI